MRPQQEYMVLVSRDLLVMLMERTGDGREVSVRELADAAGCHPSKIDALRNGRREKSLYSEALAIAKRLGVDLLVLWAHTGRTVEAPVELDHLAAVSA
ncbi:helix-turn-helix domain-containing protein [Streptomyces caniscabiei]|uniref:Helix-turn-helix transcriptional regulator n=1 Tax=Streptomyces caniscabiei TaxID=2746961 RepID=A0ABU4MQE8_9ACTN|nr:helix-turn-helix transcriptional regulator [Streptomyces caniscabiei]MBE4735778.1 helix-turn-helix transcriptional regulator [Streptomyces caniscabiei]MBE4758395.1 helix-turn-helix transcriptional regulator [Streptomyces caniscabiei]MBE4788486.1 helix-turn-helix transcriptional regulator [Streptomyces caniscabiei]MBE4796194.1 helix-turn-helix transcriptional regulator [Streptomyces caniscabiei]MDX2944502.1 helix-turn-helix transcriptional regulator [Streptomyces caniscabiei]